ADIVDLTNRSAIGAMHNSRQRGEAPKCHPNTRVAVQEYIFGWITDGEGDEEPKQIMWLTGPAGTGKTAIMGSVADTCYHRGLLVGSFFFSAVVKSNHVRSKARFVITLAYQIQQHPALKRTIGRKILSAVVDDPGIFEKSCDEQLEVLVLQPLHDCRQLIDELKPDKRPRVIVVDGLDEC
ncbi:hypothetical protein FA13DRAFT_1602760, partial [Coprinellus micaceus]